MRPPGAFAKAVLAIAPAALAAALLVPSASATTFAADRLTDDGVDGCAVGGCTLREAVMAANDHPGADVVTMGEGRYVLSRAGAGEDAGATGDLDLRGPLTIAGRGVDKTRIDAQPIGISAPGDGDRVFDLHGGQVTLRGFRTDNSEVRGDGGGIRAAGSGALLLDGVRIANATADAGRGGGVFSDRGYSLRLVNSRVDDDHAGRAGGGIYSRGRLVMSRSAADDNEAAGSGGAIFAAGPAILSHSGVHDSAADRFGGAIAASGRLTIRASVIGDARARMGGGGVYLKGGATRDSISRTTIISQHAEGRSAKGGAILVDGPRLGITNSTIAYDEASRGGGAIAATGGRVLLSSVTIANNVTAHGRGGGLLGAGGIIAMRNTIVAANRAGRRPGDCAGTVRSKGHNLSGFHCSGLSGADVRTRHPLLGPLGKHGGPNRTFSLRSGSPAIDAGGAGCPPHDQRGFARRGRCDIGAYEFRGIPPRRVRR